MSILDSERESVPTLALLRHRGAAGRDADLTRAEAAARVFLESLGVDCSTVSTVDSPRRMARAYAEMLTAREFELTTFPNEERYDELVVVCDIPFQSVCEHHLLPFTGRAHVGYPPGERILGCRSSRAWSRCSPAGPRCRSGSLCRSAAGWTASSPREAWGA